MPDIFVKDAPTRVFGSEFTLPPGQERTFRGGVVPRHRKQFVISHEGANDGSTGLNAVAHVSAGPDTGSNMSGDGGTPAKLMTVFPLDSQTLFTSASLTVRNNTSKNLKLRVLETFYL